MKKYFISFVYNLNGGFAWANCVKTSLGDINLEILRRWETEIKDSSKGVERVDILFFREIK